ncbi:MAG: hypothetical protein ACI9OD_002118 [Limisphaerales bacterium]|jgi:hypothetical protein
MNSEITKAAPPDRPVEWHPMYLTGWAMVAAFGTYFCMYGFRKPFAAATYDGVASFGVAFKVLAVSSQLLGYTLSKFIGIKVVPELRPEKRATLILWLIGGAELALLLFGLLPRPINLVALFLNGLALGMVFGLVLGFLEGRKVTEALIAGLCASFILASGVSKSVGRWLISLNVPEEWMPFCAGAFFLLPLLGFVWMLRRIPPASAADVHERTERTPMSSADRKAHFRKYAPGLCLLVLVYVTLTMIRSIRDDFGVELWQALGHSDKPGIFTESETWVMFGVLAVTGLTITIRDNRKAFFVSIGASAVGLLTIMGISIALLNGTLGGFWFMVWLGLGLYVPYTMFHTTVFERLVALLKDKATITYHINLADAFGYLAYVLLMLTRDSMSSRADLLSFFLQLTFGLALLAIALLIAAACYFNRKH